MTDEIDPHSSPGGDKRGDDTDPEAPDHGLRRVWHQIPPGLRTVIPLVLLLAVVVVGFYHWVRPRQTIGRICRADSFARCSPDPSRRRR